jgi:hypothetical protein
MDLLPPTGRIFGLTMAFIVVSTPSGSSPVVDLVAMDSKQCINDGGERPDCILKFPARSFL